MYHVTGKELVEESREQSQRLKNSTRYSFTHWYRNTIVTLMLSDDKRLAVYKYWLTTKNVDVGSVAKCEIKAFYHQLLENQAAFQELFGHDLPEDFVKGRYAGRQGIVKDYKTVLNLIASARLARELDAQYDAPDPEGHYVIGHTSAKILAGKWRQSVKYLIGTDGTAGDAASAEKQYAALVLRSLLQGSASDHR